jgi:hypothetical protein
LGTALSTRRTSLCVNIWSMHGELRLLAEKSDRGP